MYGRISYFRGSADAISEAAQIARDNKTVKQRLGLTKLYFLGDSKSGKALMIALWDTQANMRAAEISENGVRSEIADKLGGTEPPKVEEIDLIEDVGPELKRLKHGSFAHVVRFRGAKNRVDEGQQFVHDTFTSTQQRGFQKALYFGDRIDGDVLLVMFWDSAESMRAATQWANATRAQFGATLGETTPPEMEEYEVEEVEPGPPLELRQWPG